MTAAELLLLMATMQCHTLVVDVPERRESVVQTVCVKTEVTPMKQETKPVKRVVKKTTKCKKRWYWRHHRKYWKCVR